MAYTEYQKEPYTNYRILSRNKYYILIEDVSNTGQVSVTNSIEHVISQIYNTGQYYSNMLFFYIDSQGEMTRVDFQLIHMSQNTFSSVPRPVMRPVQLHFIDLPHIKSQKELEEYILFERLKE